MLRLQDAAPRLRSLPALPLPFRFLAPCSLLKAPCFRAGRRHFVPVTSQPRSYAFGSSTELFRSIAIERIRRTRASRKNENRPEARSKEQGARSEAQSGKFGAGSGWLRRIPWALSRRSRLGWFLPRRSRRGQTCLSRSVVGLASLPAGYSIARRPVGLGAKALDHRHPLAAATALALHSDPAGREKDERRKAHQWQSPEVGPAHPIQTHFRTAARRADGMLQPECFRWW